MGNAIYMFSGKEMEMGKRGVHDDAEEVEDLEIAAHGEASSKHGGMRWSLGGADDEVVCYPGPSIVNIPSIRWKERRAFFSRSGSI